MRHIPRVLCLCFVISATVPSFALPAGAGPQAWLATQRLFDGDLAAPLVTSDPVTGSLVALRAGTIPLADGFVHPAAAACGWVRAHLEAFGLRPGVDQVEVERDELLPGGSHRVLLAQYWNGVPVEAGDARCIVDPSGRLRFMASGFLGAIAAPVASRLTRAAAIANAANAAGVPLWRAPADAGLWVRRRGGTDALAWAVRFSLASGLEPRVWVDAVSGTVLEIETGCANAVGLVYPSDPRGPLEERPLLRLEPGTGLVSRLLGIDDELNPPVTPLGPGGDYRYPPSDSVFDQVNVYWHADHYLHDFMGDLGYAGPSDSLIVRIHAAIDPYVAFTNGRFVYLGRPVSGLWREVGQCQDIIYHELTHAVIYGYGIGPTGPNREAAAFHEGVADYFAAALTGDPVIGEWLYLVFPDGVTRLDQPLPRWTYCNYDHVSFGGGSGGSQWGNGMILSSALWDLRREIGTSADSLVLEALVYLPTAPIWAQFANALLQADQDHHAGRFAPALIAALVPRCIRGAVAAAIRGPSTLRPGVEGEFTADPCCGGVSGSAHWRVRAWCRGAPCGDWRDAGDGMRLMLALDDDSEIQLTLETPWGDTLTSSRFVGVRPPELVIEGPARVGQHLRATWKARFAAMGPAHVTWMRQWRRAGSVREQLGEDLERSFAADTSLDLTATLVDGLGRVIRQNLTVETFVDHPPPLATGVIHLTLSLDAAARRAEATFELTQATPLRLTVFDVRGRVRATLWDGPAERGVHVVRWDAGGLEPGVYFLRLLAEPSGLLRRFVLMR